MNTPHDFSHHLAEVLDSLSTHVVGVRSGGRATSGTVWGTDLVVGALHGLRHQSGARVVLADGSEHDAEVIGTDAGTDLALLQIQDAGLSPPPTAPASSLRVGNLVLTAARPGTTLRATHGMVSGISTDSWRTPLGSPVDHYIEVDANLPPGFSGGPLLRLDGTVVGINTSGVVRGGTTIPVATVDRVVAALRAHGTISRGFLGVGVQPVVIPDGQLEEAGQAHGLIITALEPGGAADAGGLLLGDLLLSAQQQPLSHWRDLVAALLGRSGVDTELRLIRAGAVQTLNLEPGERPLSKRRCK